LSSALYCTTISGVDAKGSDSNLANEQTMETILGLGCDVRHYGRHKHHPVHQTPLAFYGRQ